MDGEQSSEPTSRENSTAIWSTLAPQQPYFKQVPFMHCVFLSDIFPNGAKWNAEWQNPANLSSGERCLSTEFLNFLWVNMKGSCEIIGAHCAQSHALAARLNVNSLSSLNGARYGSQLAEKQNQ